jgi:ABC-type cobalamin/Fe3+-siderophores transport system ATPase subunit
MNASTLPIHRLEAEALRLAHGRTPVIKGLDLALPPGQVTAIVGPNGCGKSTLLAGLARLHAPGGGAVLLDGEDFQRLPARELARRLALLPQQTPLLLLDEPTSALDLGHQLEVFELVRRLAGAGRTLALVLHDLASACRYADHLVAMRDGRIVAQGAPAEVVTEALVRELYGVACTLIHDPASGTPILTDLRRLPASR